MPQREQNAFYVQNSRSAARHVDADKPGESRFADESRFARFGPATALRAFISIRCGRAALLVGFALTLAVALPVASPGTARADDGFFIGSPRVETGVWLSHVKLRYQGVALYQLGLEAGLIDRLSKAGSDAATQEMIIANYRQKLDSEVSSQHDALDPQQHFWAVLHAMGEVVQAGSAGGNATGQVLKGVAELGQEYIRQETNNLRAEDALTSIQQRAQLQAEHEKTWLNNLVTLRADAQKSNATAKVISEVFDTTSGPTLDAHLTSSAQDVFQVDPLLERFLHEEGLINDSTNDLKTTVINGVAGVQLSQAKMQKAIEGKLGDIQNTVGAVVDTLGSINAKQDALGSSFAAYVNNQSERQAQEDAARAAQAVHQRELAGEKATVGLLADLISPIDPALAAQASTIGNAAINIGESLSQWSTAVAGIGDLASLAVNPLALLDTASMVGNVVGSVQAVMSLFGGPHQPDPNELILQGIQKLSKQISQLGSVMSDRFDRVDKELNAVFTGLTSDLDQLSQSLHGVAVNVETLVENVSQLTRNVDQLSRDMQTFAAEGARQEVIVNRSTYLDWSAKNPGAGPLQETDFIKAESYFATWALHFATDTRVNLAGTEPDGPLDVPIQLSKFPVENLVNYLGEVASDHLSTPALFTTNPLPDPFDWALGAQAYVALAAQWPQYAAHQFASATGGSPADNQTLDALIAEGQDIKRNLAGIATSKTLFSRLFARYKGHLDNLLAALSTESTDQLSQAATGIPGGAQTEASLLWGAPNQALPTADVQSVIDLKGQISHCTRTDYRPISVPSNVTPTDLLPPEALMAARLGLGTVRICYAAPYYGIDGDLVGRVRPGNRQGDPPSSATALAAWTISGQYQKAGSSSWRTLRYLSYGTGKREPFCFWTKPQLLWVYQCFSRDGKGGEGSWLEVKSQFQQSAVHGEDRAADAAVLADVATKQQTLRDGYYAGMASALTTPHDADGSAVAQAAQALGGDKQLIIDYMRLGFPTAVSLDDYLHSLLEGQPLIVQTNPTTPIQTISPDGSIIGCQQTSQPACTDLFRGAPDVSVGGVKG